MPNSLPAVSIVVPTFNEPRATLEKSFTSISEQTFRAFECLVIDESTDPDLAAACQELCGRDARFHYVHPEKRLGIAGSLNLGIALARANLIARFDADDLCMKRRLEMQFAYMEAHPEVGVLGGCLEIVDDGGNTIAFRRYPTNHNAIVRQFHLTTPIAHPSVIMRKSVFDVSGGYDERFPNAEDLELWLRLLRRGVRFANLDEVLIRYRQINAIRPKRHWKYNVAARIRHLSLRRLPFCLIGIAALSAWKCLPSRTQARLYNLLLLRRKIAAPSR